MSDNFWVIVGLVILVLALVFIGVLALQILWNWIMPSIFGLPIITYWQAMGIEFLTILLFGRVTRSKSN